VIRVATKTRMASGMNKVTSKTKYFRWLTRFALPPVDDMGNVTFNSCKVGHSFPRMAILRRFEAIDTPDLEHPCSLLSVRAHSDCGFVAPEYRYMTNI